MHRHLVLVLAGLLLSAPAAAQQDSTTAQDPAGTTSATESPSLQLPGLPFELPQPAPGASPAPAPAAPTAPSAPAEARPMTLVFTETVVSARAGKKVYEPNAVQLTLSPEQEAALRAGQVTPELRAEVEGFAAKLDREPRDARFEYAPLSDEWYIAMQSGVKVDVDATLAALQGVAGTMNGTRASVVYTRTLPKRTLDFFLQRGVTTLVGDGVTSFFGSSPARVKNIEVGAKAFSDVLFDGKTFSFNQMVGPITLANGYVTGLVISGERTANGVGGGICQVSTTVFRTLYFAGLPIVQRKPHSYQVHYYDPQGLDATIYQPSLDLKFANDTGGALWFQSEVDTENEVLRVVAFGRPRAETVVIGEPRTLATRPSPAAKFLPDRSVAPGKKVQVDWAAPGATIEVERRFVLGGKTVRSDVLRSTYRPWPDIFLVNPASLTEMQRQHGAKVAANKP